MTTDSLNELPAVCMWMDRNIEELSREELLGVVRYLAKQVESSRDDHNRTLRMWELCRKASS